jgi:hypothetical protein
MQSRQAAGDLPLFFCGITRAATDYSEHDNRTQGKTAKNAGKMRFFLKSVEITAKNGPLERPGGSGEPISASRLAMKHHP